MSPYNKFLLRMYFHFIQTGTVTFDSLPSPFSNRDTTQDEDSSLITTSLVIPLVLNIYKKALPCVILWAIYHYRNHIFASIEQIKIRIIKVIWTLCAILMIRIYGLYLVSIIVREGIIRGRKASTEENRGEEMSHVADDRGMLFLLHVYECRIG